MTEFPAKEFCEINRVLFLAFDECGTDEQTQAYQDANRDVAAASKAVKRLFDILKKEKQ